MRFTKPLQFDVEERCFSSIPQSFYALFHKMESLRPSFLLRDSGSLRHRFYITDLGPYSWKILVLRVAPSNKNLRKFLEMWVFPLKFKEKILVKKKVIQKAS